MPSSQSQIIRERKNKTRENGPICNDKGDFFFFFFYTTSSIGTSYTALYFSLKLFKFSIPIIVTVKLYKKYIYYVLVYKNIL